jgi:hypothetical protein
VLAVAGSSPAAAQSPSSGPIPYQGLLRTLLDASDVPSGLTPSAIGDGTSWDLAWSAYLANGGIAAVDETWKASAPQPVVAVFDFRMQFPTDEAAAAYLSAGEATLSERDSTGTTLVQDARPIGDGYRHYRGTTTNGGQPYVLHVYLFHVGPIAAKVAVAGLDTMDEGLATVIVTRAAEHMSAVVAETAAGASSTDGPGAAGTTIPTPTPASPSTGGPTPAAPTSAPTPAAPTPAPTPAAPTPAALTPVPTPAAPTPTPTPAAPPSPDQAGLERTLLDASNLPPGLASQGIGITLADIDAQSFAAHDGLAATSQYWTGTPTGAIAVVGEYRMQFPTPDDARAYLQAAQKKLSGEDDMGLQSSPDSGGPTGDGGYSVGTTTNDSGAMVVIQNLWFRVGPVAARVIVAGTGVTPDDAVTIAGAAAGKIVSVFGDADPVQPPTASMPAPAPPVAPQSPLASALAP